MKSTLAYIAWVFSICVAIGSVHAESSDFMFRANVNGEILEGKPLHWSSTQMLLLGRNGQLYEFNPKIARDAVKTGARYASYSAPEMKMSLEHEFGNQFEVSSIRHFVVVHPRGERDQWAHRFEELYDRFEHYFGVRGFELQEPLYPLVAVVFRDQDEYYRNAAANGTPLPPNWLGHYDPRSNRVFLFDSTAKNHNADWSENASTIIHEATHQMAYNTGIHRRFAGAPRWLAEGLATMFEAKGVWNAQYDRTQSDRINRGRLDSFRDYVAKRRQPGSIQAMLSSDDMFRSDQDGAYAQAWALSFYLSETQPRAYAQYLTKTADRPMFSEYSPVERVADFQTFFGSESKIFESKFLSYMAEVK
jgi:hypothetical protein